MHDPDATMSNAMLEMERDQTWQLVVDAAAGDPQARACFSLQFQPVVHRWLAYRWRHTPFRGLVDDAAQDVFVECFRSGGALGHLERERATHGFTGYLRGVVHNVAARLERTEARFFRRRRNLDIDAVSAPPPDVDGGLESDRAWALEQVGAALVLLDAADRHPPAGHTLRELLHLHFAQNMPVRAIAHAWHEQVDHVHELRRRACGLFRTCLLRVRRGGMAQHRATGTTSP